MYTLKNFKKINIINLITCLIVPFLIWGPFFPDLIISTSSLIFLYYLLKNKNFYFFNKVPIIGFFLFWIITVISSLLADDISLSLKSSFFYFRIGLFACFIWYLIDKDKSIIKYFYYVLVICFTVLVVDGYFQYFTGKNLLGIKIDSSLRISSFFKDELILGSYLSRLFPLLFALFLVKQKQKFEIYFIGVLFILVDVLIYLSGERSSFFFLNLSTIFIIILIKEYQKFRLITFIIAIICITIFSYNIGSTMTNRMFTNPAKDMGFIKSSKDPVIFTKEHDSLIRTAYKMFKDHPILGHGPKMFRVKCEDQKYAVSKDSCSTHPHNFYLQLLAETGIIGFLFLFVSLIYVLYAALRQFKTIIFGQKRFLKDYQVCLLAAILITVWPLSPNGNFFHNWLMIIYSLPVGFYLQSIYSKNNLKNL